MMELAELSRTLSASQPMLAFPFAALAGAVLPGLVGGLFNRNDEKKNRRSAGNAAGKDYARQRKDYTDDRFNERAYARRITAGDRAYNERQTAKDRQYAERLVASDRRYAERVLNQDRAYTAGLTKDDRRYSEHLARVDRANMVKDRAAGEQSYRQDRERMQKRANNLAERTAASRGIDFARMRDDAIKAGFNPLTAMAYAANYSTEVGYSPVGDVYSGHAAYSSGRSVPGTTASGGGSVTPSTMVGSVPGTSVVAGGGGFQSSGGGYSSSFEPRLSSGGFLAEALDSGIQTYFNTVNDRDRAVYENIAGQVARGHIQREVLRQMPRQFGYSLAKVEPYSPSVGALTPPFSPSDEGVGASSRPLTFPGGYALQPTSGASDSDTWETRYGDVPAGLIGAGSLVYDVWKQGNADERGLFASARYRDGRPAPRPSSWKRTTAPRIAPGTAAFALGGGVPVGPGISQFMLDRPWW